MQIVLCIISISRVLLCLLIKYGFLKRIMKCITFYMRRKSEEVQSVCSKSPKTSELICYASDKHMVYIGRQREKRNAYIEESIVEHFQ